MGLEGREIAVIGAGIGGLAAATALAARRASVTVFEQAPALAEVGAGIQIGPNGVAVLEALGLRDAAEVVASVPVAIELRDHASGRLVARVPLGHTCVARYGRPYWQFHRADLLAVLAEGAREAGCRFRLGARVTEIETDGAKPRVAVGEEVADFDAVVAADGVRSQVRTALFGGRAPRFTGHVAWRGLVEAARLPPALSAPEVRVTMGPGRHLVTYPLRGGKLVNFVAAEARREWVGEGWMTTDDPANLRAAFEGWGEDAEALAAAVDETWLWGLFDHPPLADWTRGPVALLGDACHPMLPFLAQGATMALEDAWVLAAELDIAGNVEHGIHAYAARRQRRTARVQRAAARNGRLYHLSGPSRLAAQLGLRAASAVAPGALLGRFDWLYGADVVSARATA